VLSGCRQLWVTLLVLTGGCNLAQVASMQDLVLPVGDLIGCPCCSGVSLSWRVSKLCRVSTFLDLSDLTVG